VAKAKQKRNYFRDTKSCYDRVVAAQRERAMTEQVFEKVHDCGQIFSVRGLFGGSFCCHQNMCRSHCCYYVIMVYLVLSYLYIFLYKKVYVL